MAKQKLSFVFVNPNSGKDFERLFRQILIDRLISVHKQNVFLTG